VDTAALLAANPDVRDTLKLAEQLDESRDLLQKPAGKRRAVTALNRIIADKPGTPAAKLAADWLQAQNLATAPAKAAKGFRTWTSDSGTTVEATLVDFGQQPTAKNVPTSSRKKRRATRQVPFAAD
jgi:hypothetical protein